eukprot:139179_1
MPQCACFPPSSEITNPSIMVSKTIAAKVVYANNRLSTSRRTILSNINSVVSNDSIPSVEINHKLIKNLYKQFPEGIIMIWYGSISHIPLGWSLCNGSNGTPDLRDKFVIGSGNLYTLNDTGGTENIALTINDIPSHSHNISHVNVATSVHTGHSHDSGSYSLSTQNGHTHNYNATTSSTGSHNHLCSASTFASGNHNHNNGEYNKLMRIRSDCCGTESGTDCSCGGYPDLQSCADTITTGNHTHSVSCSTGDTGSHIHVAAGTTGNEGTHTHIMNGSTSNSGIHSHSVSGVTEPVGTGISNTINVLNPYYAAYYIMKVSNNFEHISQSKTGTPTTTSEVPVAVSTSIKSDDMFNIGPSDDNSDIIAVFIVCTIVLVIIIIAIAMYSRILNKKISALQQSVHARFIDGRGVYNDNIVDENELIKNDDDIVAVLNKTHQYSAKNNDDDHGIVEAINQTNQ